LILLINRRKQSTVFSPEYFWRKRLRHWLRQRSSTIFCHSLKSFDSQPPPQQAAFFGYFLPVIKRSLQNSSSFILSAWSIVYYTSSVRRLSRCFRPQPRWVPLFISNKTRLLCKTVHPNFASKLLCFYLFPICFCKLQRFLAVFRGFQGFFENMSG